MKPTLIKNVEVLAVTGTSQRFTAALVQGGEYYLICSKACWIKVTTSAGSASAATGSCYVPADTFVPITRESLTENRLAIIRAAEDCTASLAIATAGG
jgi:hypothetical protein